jgi:predicted nucleic acid-binding protein
MTLVDTNVLIDLVQDDPQWADWSEEQLTKAQKKGPLYINVVGYAEMAPALDSIALLDDFLKRCKISVKDISRPAAYLAGEVFLRYRQRKGTKTGVLADFFIGAQAQTEGWTILSRDAGRYKTYFPRVKLITPLV